MDAGNGTGRAVAEINVTPLIDVLLVVLIIFMVSQPQALVGLSSQIPQPAKPDTTPPSTVVVEVFPDASGQPVYRINQTAYPQSQVAAELKAIFASRPDRTMFIKGDAVVTFQDVAEVVDMGHQAGVETIGLITPQVEVGR